jgi:hypothetical protein
MPIDAVLARCSFPERHMGDAASGTTVAMGRRPSVHSLPELAHTRARAPSCREGRGPGRSAKSRRVVGQPVNVG